MNDLASPYCIYILVYICSYIFIYGYILAYKHAYVSALGVYCSTYCPKRSLPAKRYCTLSTAGSILLGIAA